MAYVWRSKDSFPGLVLPSHAGAQGLPQVLSFVGPVALTYATSLRGHFLPGSLLLRRVLIFLNVHRYVSANPPAPVEQTRGHPAGLQPSVFLPPRDTNM